MGKCGKDVPLETQFMLVESNGDGASDDDEADSQTIYTVFLPLLEGPFRAALQGNDKNEIEICLESGEYRSIIRLSQLKCLKWIRRIC